MNPIEMSRRLASATGAEYDCQRCGACCLSQRAEPGYVELTAAEAKRLAVSLPLVVVAGKHFLGTESYDGPGGVNACSGFSGAPGFPCACHLYDERPQKCRDFEMGSAACRTARLHAGLPI